MYTYSRVAPMAYLLRLFRHPKTDAISAVVFSADFVGTVVLESNGKEHYHSKNLQETHAKYDIRSAISKSAYFVQHKDPDNLTEDDLTLVICGKGKYELFNRILDRSEQVRLIDAINRATKAQRDYSRSLAKSND